MPAGRGWEGLGRDHCAQSLQTRKLSLLLEATSPGLCCPLIWLEMGHPKALAPAVVMAERTGLGGCSVTLALPSPLDPWRSSWGTLPAKHCA